MVHVELTFHSSLGLIPINDNNGGLVVRQMVDDISRFIYDSTLGEVRLMRAMAVVAQFGEVMVRLRRAGASY